MSADVEGYLAQKGLHLKGATGWNRHTACFYCGEDPQDRGRLYVNCDPEAEIPGLHICFLCGRKGSLQTIKKHFGDQDESPKEEHHEVRREILASAAHYYHTLLGEHDDAFAWLRGPERGLEVQTIIDYQLGYADGTLYHHLRDEGFRPADILATGLVHEDRQSKKLVDSLRNMVTIPYFTAGNVTMIRGRAYPFDGTGPKYKTCGGNKARLYNSDVCWETDEVAAVEGEFDALVLLQLGVPAVGVPGANVWQDSWDAYVSEMRRIWLVFDRDSAGEQGAEKLASKFGHKVKRVHLSPPGIKCDPTKWVAELGHNREDFEKLQREAATGGLLVTVEEAVAEHSEHQGKAGFKLGFEKLDSYILPGLQRSQLLIILARTGAGKTMALLNLMHRMAMVKGQENLKFLFISLEQTRGEWFERARRIYRFYNLDDADQDCSMFWRERLLMVDKNRLSQEQLYQALDDYEYMMGCPPDVLVIDYLGYWARAFKGEDYQRTSDAVMALKEVAKERRIPIITPHQVSRVAKFGEEPDADAGRASGVIEETADFLLVLWKPDDLKGREEGEKQGIVNLRVVKSRHGGSGMKAELQWGPVSLVLVPKEDRDVLVRKARCEVEWASRLVSWEEAVRRHRVGLEGMA